MQEGWLERGGVRLHYLEWRPEDAAEGGVGIPPSEQKPALFLLHGLSSNARVWERMAARLPGRRIVALDQRSHGLSDRPAAGYTAAELAADAAHAVQSLDLELPAVAGHSWGGAVALDFAARFPALVSGLAIVDGPIAAMSRSMTWEQAAQRMQPPFPTYADLDSAAAAQAAYLDGAWQDDLRDFVEAGLTRTPAGYVSTLSVPVRLAILRELYAHQPEALLARVNGPLLIAVAGRAWRHAPPSFMEQKRRSAEAVLAIRPDAQVRWYDSPHDIPLVRPRELAADLEDTVLTAADPRRTTP